VAAGIAITWSMQVAIEVDVVAASRGPLLVTVDEQGKTAGGLLFTDGGWAVYALRDDRACSSGSAGGWARASTSRSWTVWWQTNGSSYVDAWATGIAEALARTDDRFVSSR
jgi:hypothetical protein